MRTLLLHAIIGLAFFTVSRAETIFAINQFDRRLLALDSSAPGDVTRTEITGLRLGDELIGIDFDTATGQLYAVGRDPVINNRTPAAVYTLNPTTAAATLKFLLPSPLDEASYGLDIDSVGRRLHLVSDVGSSLFVNIDNGSAITGPLLSYGPGDVNFGRVPVISGWAYPASASSPVYGIDTAAGVLASLPSPGGTELMTIGPLGLDRALFRAAGFDISEQTGTAYVVLGLSGDPADFDLFRVDLRTGTVSPLGTLFQGFDSVVGIAVQPSRTPIPEPVTAVYIGIGLIGAICARILRRRASANLRNPRRSGRAQRRHRRAWTGTEDWRIEDKKATPDRHYS